MDLYGVIPHGRPDDERNPSDKLASLFVADTLLASQFNDLRRSRADEPMARLWCAILEDAIRCFLAGALSDARSRRGRAYADAREWLFDGGGRISFALICDGLGLDQDYFRESLTRVAERGLPSGADNIPRRAPTTSGHDKITDGDKRYRRHLERHRSGLPKRRLHNRCGQSF